MIVINFKEHAEALGYRARDLAYQVGRSSRKYGVPMAVAPSWKSMKHMDGLGVTVFAQYVGLSKESSIDNFLKYDLKGSLINHNDHPQDPFGVSKAVGTMKKLGAVSVVCAKNVEESRAYAKLNPTYVAIEPTSLIGTGKSVSYMMPQDVMRSKKAVDDAGNSTESMCGAGVSDGKDVAASIRLGMSGVLLSSAVVKAPAGSWDVVLDDLASSFAKHSQKRL